MVLSATERAGCSKIGKVLKPTENSKAWADTK